MSEFLTLNDYKKALDSQSACNLSGIVKSLAEVMDRLWMEANQNGHGTDWINQHPICRLYAEQIGFLTGMTTDDTSYAKADQAICDHIAALEALPK